jgi:hypothetical protein
MTAVASAPIDRRTVIDALQQIASYGVASEAHAGLVDVGTEAYLKYFEAEVLDGLILHGGSTCRFFDGNYGAGKTHLLRLLEASARKRGLAVVRTELTHDLGFDDWQSITQTILETMELTVAGQHSRGLPAVLEALANSGEFQVTKLRQARLPHAGFQAAMLRVVTTQRVSASLRRFFRAEGVTGVKDPLSARNAEMVLYTVIGGLYQLGIPGTLLLFDENESSLFAGAHPTQRLRRAANTMRRMIDSCSAGGLVGTLAVFAVLPDFIAQCAHEYPALGQRLEASEPVGRGAWRWPVLPVTAVSTLAVPEDFLAAAVERINQLLIETGSDAARVYANASRMSSEGTAELARHAGSGYRRDLMKLLASLALDTMPEGSR